MGKECLRQRAWSAQWLEGFFCFFFPHAQGPAKRPVWLGPVKEGSGEDVEFKS